MKRRHFVLGTAGAAGALLIGWSLLPPRQRLQPGRPLPASAGQAVFNGYLKIDADDRVTVVCPKAEMGQGVHTGLAMLLAEELHADWSRIAVEHAPLDAVYNNVAAVVDGLPFRPDDEGWLKALAGWMTTKAAREFGLVMTGGSSSLKDLWLPMRQAGASARQMLVAAAAGAWGVPAREVQAVDGELRHAGGRRARFGEFAQAAARQPLPRDPPLKPPAQWRFIGQPLPRLEAADKSRGRAPFGIDVQLPGLLHASVVMCPTLGGRAATVDDREARAVPGVQRVLIVRGHAGGTGGVAVVADHPWRALKAARLLRVRWDEAVPAAAFDSGAALDDCARGLEHDAGFALHRQGDVDAALAGAATRLQAEYRAPFLAHMAMEPINCTVRVDEQAGRATVWAPTQAPGLVQRSAARALGIASERVDVQVTLLGGGFGRRLESDFAGQAAQIAQAFPGRPVKTLWSREEDTRHDFYRPACVARLEAGLDSAGRPVAWRHVSAGPAIVPQLLGRQFGLPDAGPDKTTLEGAYDQAYEWPAARVAHRIVEMPVPVGFWRAVGHSHQAFFKEAFIDELAQAAGADPLDFRLALLQQHPRQRRVLQAAANAAGWGRGEPPPAPDGAQTARGLALHESFGSVVAQVAEVSLDAQRQIRVHRVFCAIDCGQPVNPNLIRQQMDSAVVFGLSAALHGEIHIERGRVREGNFNDQPVLRLAACPRVFTEVLPGEGVPEGVGEPGTPPIAPAVANAVFRLTGQRLRSLPLRLA